jgi:hypothetical protein
VSCLKEGDAYLSMVLYAEEVYGPDWEDLEDGTEEAAPEDEVAIPPAIERYFALDYTECVAFASALYFTGGWKKLDEAYDEPPWTTEQVLHPEKYDAREGARSDAPDDLSDSLGDGWTLAEQAQFGEFDVYNYLLTNIGDETIASGAAAGWGAGWGGIYTFDSEEAGDATLVHLQLDWDTSQDFAEFLVAYGILVDRTATGGVSGNTQSGPVRWAEDGQFGYAQWHPGLSRVDIVLTTSEAAREFAANGLQ